MLMAIKRRLKFKFFTFSLKHHKLAGKIQIVRSTDRLTGWQLNREALRIVIRKLTNTEI